MRVKFWGTRGLISSPGAHNAIFGGNTICMQIIHEDHLIIVDTGFGASLFGEHLMPRITRDKEALNVHILYTHFHWDHIQGLPFFHPIYFPSTNLYLYSPETPENMIDSLDVLFDGSYSPFAGIKKMPSQIHFCQFHSAFEIGGLVMDSLAINHGETATKGHATYAYRITDKKTGEKVVIATDHEANPNDPKNEALITFAKDCDLFIHDGQYTDQEYKKRLGWGHSSMPHALLNAIKCTAKNTLLVHHDPAHTDAFLLSETLRLKRDPRFSTLEFEFAREGHIYELRKENEKDDKTELSKSA